MRRAEAELCRLLVKLCDSVTRPVIDRVGVSRIERVAYLDFGREVFGRRRRYGGRTLANELEYVRGKWTVRGLDPRLLREVEQGILAALEEHLTSPD